MALGATFRGQKVLVAGGTGLIGRELVALLVEAGAKLRVASLDDPARAHPDAEFIRADLTSLERCMAVCHGMDFVFNLLGVKGSPAVAVRRAASFLVPTLAMNTSLMEAARRAGVGGFLFTSSVGVYAPAEVLREDDVWRTLPSENDRFAGWAKRMGELQAEAYRLEYGWDRIAVVRPANVYGAFDNFDLENATAVAALIKRAVDGEDPLVVWGDGSAERDFVHARDVARGTLLVAENMPPHPVNLGSGVPVSIRRLVETIVGNLDRRPEVRWDTAKPSGDRRRVLDITRARALGFEPAVTLEAGVRETLAWYRDNRKSLPRRYDVFDR
jgi:GDP-L-fucose synthase